MSVIWNEARIRKLEYKYKELQERYYELSASFHRLADALELVEVRTPPEIKFVKVKKEGLGSL